MRGRLGQSARVGLEMDSCWRYQNFSKATPGTEIGHRCCELAIWCTLVDQEAIYIKP